jgi:cell division protein FtsB
LTAQFDRLKQDVIELETYITKLKKKGKTDLATKISRKREYLKDYIAEKQQALQ